MNLRSLVTQVLDTSVIADPEDIADEVLRRISKSQSRDALEQALPTYIRTTISSRRSSLGATPRPALTPGQGAAFHMRGVTVSDAWQKSQRDRVKVPGTGWMFLGEMSHEHLRSVADHLDELAASHRTKARRYRALESALIEFGAERVKDLPAEVLMPLLGAKAA